MPAAQVAFAGDGIPSWKTRQGLSLLQRKEVVHLQETGGRQTDLDKVFWFLPNTVSSLGNLAKEKLPFVGSQERLVT